MRRYEVPFAFPAGGTTNETSGAERVGFCVDQVVQVDGTFSATVTLQGRVSPAANFIDLPGALSAPGLIKPASPMSDLRLVISGFASGTVTATFAGTNTQQG